MPDDNVSTAQDSTTTAPASGGDWQLGDVFAAIAAEPEPTKPPAATEATDEEPEKEQPSKPRAAKETPGQVDEAKLFSDEALATKEGLQAAKEYVLAKQRKAQAMWAQEQKRSQKFKAKLGAFVAERDQFKAEAEQLKTVREHLVTDLQLFRSGNPQQRLEALGRLTGEDPVKLLEDWNIEVASGKKRQADPEAKKALEEVERLRAELRRADEERAARRAQAEQEQALAQGKTKLLETVRSGADEWPLLAAFSEDDPEEVTDGLLTVLQQHYEEHGTPLPWHEAAAMLESNLEKQARRASEALAKRGAPKGASGLDTRAAQAKPAQAQSSPQTRGRSLAPGLSQLPTGARRDVTDEEQPDAADLIPDFFSQLARGY